MYLDPPGDRIIGGMSDHAAASWVEKVERTFGLEPPQRRSARFLWGMTACWAVVVASAALQFAGAGEIGTRWFAVTLALNQTLVLGAVLGEALRVGAFGGRYRRQGKALQLATSVASFPMCAVLLAATGYVISDDPRGVLTGGAVGAIFCVVGVSYSRWIRQVGIRETAESESQQSS